MAGKESVFHTPQKDTDRAQEEMFAAVSHGQLRQFLTTFVAERKMPDAGLISNLQAAKTVIAFTNTFVDKQHDVSLRKIDKRTESTFADWISGEWVVPFTPLKQGERSRRFHKGIDQQALAAYAAFGWGLAQLREIERKSGQKIPRRAVIDITLKGLGEHELTSQIAVTAEQKKNAALRYENILEVMKDGFSFEEATELFETSQGELRPANKEKKKRGGTIPCLNEKQKKELHAFDSQRLEHLADMIEAGGLPLSSGVITPETYASMYFTERFLSGNFHDYDPYPETVNRRETVHLLRITGMVIQGLQEKHPALPLNNFGDIYPYVVRSAQDKGLILMDSIEEETLESPHR